MKTSEPRSSAIAFPSGPRRLEAPKPFLRVAHKSDLRNHRFAVLEQNPAQQPENWDAAWFTNYE